MSYLIQARPLGPTNGRQRRSDDEVAEVDAELKRITEELWTRLLWGDRDETKRRVKEVRGELNALLQKLDAGTHGEYSDKIKEVISVLDAVTENIDRSV
ncbi:unnamed protein product [Nippostrongylus brasiliensis]|uniref:Chemotaxis protein n=1 Tax=Nippostrongylus brasiliensis TaxID=27835 RepID=A0A0N4Y508_NIPBR|nr:unnamed protein product [Nippostrongylus brasiliensis]